MIGRGFSWNIDWEGTGDRYKYRTINTDTYRMNEDWEWDKERLGEMNMRRRV